MFKDDGCTALSWRSEDQAVLAQNWDWRASQRPNLISLTIRHPGHKLAMITEAGIIGKIGVSSAGFGVCLNAIRVRGVNYQKLPVHLALRKVLDYEKDGMLSGIAGILEAAGIASSAHILIACEKGALGLETTHRDVQELHERKNNNGKFLTHTNHLIQEHRGINECLELPDSPVRLARIDELIDRQKGAPNVGAMQQMLRDEQGYPTSICRDKNKASESVTCFSIVMDLKARRAMVKLGRPTSDGEELVLDASH